MSRLPNRIINERNGLLTDSEVDYILTTRGKSVVSRNYTEPPLSEHQKITLKQIRANRLRENPDYDKDATRLMAEYCLGLH